MRDLDRSLQYYTERLGFKARREGGVARLGAGGPDLLVLHESPGAPHPRGTTGLYHFAILVPSRPELAATLAHLFATRTLLTGASDHGVSEALYLSDAEDNGIEIYRDRPRPEWPMADGVVRMVSEPLDVGELLAGPSALPDRWPGLPAATRIGHMHLHVADLDEAERFYVSVLGFERTQRYGASALFVAAGGYHHHIGLNTWAGEGAPAPPPGAAGLKRFTVLLPDAKERDRVAARVRAASLPVTEVEGGLEVADPSSNRILLAAAG